MGAATSTENAQPSESAPSYWSIMRQGYEELVNAIIRPPRADYDPARLGPTEFEFCGRSYRREDLVLRNARGLALQCSHWAPVGSKGEPCVVFLHGNSSARLEGLNQLSVCLGFGLTLFAFDCAGSGRSEGDYVSLGYWEKDDLKCRRSLEETWRQKLGCGVEAWAPSSAAAPSGRRVRNPLWGEAPPPIKHTTNAMVLDSPFADFCQLAEELVAKGEKGEWWYLRWLQTSFVHARHVSAIKQVLIWDLLPYEKCRAVDYQHYLCANGRLHRCPAPPVPSLTVCHQRWG